MKCAICGTEMVIGKEQVVSTNGALVTVTFFVCPHCGNRVNA